MAIEDIVGTVIYAIAELVGVVVSKDKKPAKKLGVVSWIIVFILAALLLWFTITHS